VAPKKKAGKKGPKKGTPNPFPWLTGGKPCGPSGHTTYDPHLDVYCLTLRRGEIVQLLREFRNPGQKFRVLLVKGSPLASLSISPTKAAND